MNKTDIHSIVVESNTHDPEVWSGCWALVRVNTITTIHHVKAKYNNRRSLQHYILMLWMIIIRPLQLSSKHIEYGNGIYLGKKTWSWMVNGTIVQSSIN